MIALFSAIFLLLGLLNPVNNNLIDITISFFVFSFCAYTVLNFERKFFVLIVCIFISWLIFASIKEFNLAVIYGSLAGTVLGIILNGLKLLEKTAIWILIFSFLISSFVTSHDLRMMLKRDVPLYTYNNDPGVFLKTHLLMDQGYGYYEAFKIAITGRFGLQTVPGDIWSWRLPTVFLIWKVIPGTNRLSVYYLLIILFVSVFFTVFKIGQKYLGSNLGLLPAYLIFPYFHYAARDQMFLETEWWSLSIFIFGIYFFISNRLFWTTVLLSITVLVREVYILPLGLMLIYSLFREKKLIPVFTIPLFSFSLFFIFHLSQVNHYINTRGTIFSPRIISDTLLLIQKTLAFASWEYLLFQIRPFIFFLLVAIIGCLFLFFKEKKKETIFLLLSFSIFPIIFLKLGTLYNDYWGIIYVPLAIIFAPTSLLIFKNLMFHQKRIRNIA